MKILLLGDYSNVHWTLAEGLRKLGHTAVVASDGDNWKNYPRDIDLRRRSSGIRDTTSFLARVLRWFPTFRGYDVVQIINPVFLPLKAERMLLFYRFLRRHNRSVFMGAFGMDHYWVKAGLDCHTFRYSDFNIGDCQRLEGENQEFIRDWLDGPKGRLNRHIAQDCDGIIAGLYEYYASYAPYHADKLTFIPFPIPPTHRQPIADVPQKVRFFIGIQRKRNEYKGTDVMLRALEHVVAEHPDQCEMVKAESLPFPVYAEMMNSSHVILDQLYSYTPAMNALHAMSKGLVVVGGGEPENYEILNEHELRPIINVLPNENDVYHTLLDLVAHKERLPELSRQSIAYVERHHDYMKVAQNYIDFWQNRMNHNAGQIPNGGVLTP